MASADASEPPRVSALLIDGPEPLFREIHRIEFADENDTPLDVFRVTGRSECRTVLLYQEAGVMDRLPTGYLKITIEDHWLEQEGPVHEKASRSIEIPSDFKALERLLSE